MLSECISLLSPVASTSIGVSISDADAASAIYASSSCFFRWYPPVAFALLSPIVSPPLSSVPSAGASASTSGTGDMSAICASSNYFFQ